MMQLIAGGNVALTSNVVELIIQTHIPTFVELEVTAYLLSETTQKVRGDQDMIFYGQTQTPNQSVVLQESMTKDPSITRLKINTSLIDPKISKVTICATLNEPHNFSKTAPINIQLQAAGQSIATCMVQTATKTEKALILGEIYKHKEQWKFRFIDQGFNGGLKPLAENFGVEIANSPQNTTPTPTPTPTPKSNLNLSKVKLDKNNSSINLTKTGAGFGKISVNLNWNHGDDSGNFFKKLVKSKSIDLDLGAMIQFKNGGIALVQSLGNQFGSYNKPPFMHLDGDDRTGSVSNGENLYINGDQWNEISRVVIYTYIYEGVAQWAATDAVVTIKIPHQPEIEVRLTEGNSLTACAIVELKNINESIEAKREVRYFKDQQFIDEYYDFGFRWTVGSKD